MIGLVWSIALAAIGVAGLWRAGSRKRSGWAIGLTAQALWITYAVLTHQWGFIASAIAYGSVYARNLLRDRRANPIPVPEQEELTAYEALGIQPQCTFPPPGWWCSRDEGHDGPCAARRIPRRALR